MTPESVVTSIVNHAQLVGRDMLADLTTAARCADEIYMLCTWGTPEEAYFSRLAGALDNAVAERKGSK